VHPHNVTLPIFECNASCTCSADCRNRVRHNYFFYNLVE
jgi:hypothetical protein